MLNDINFFQRLSLLVMQFILSTLIYSIKILFNIFYQSEKIFILII
jgi:hypothetical protein